MGQSAYRLGELPVFACWTDRTQGDQRELVERVLGLRQVHGSEVVVAGEPSPASELRRWELDEQGSPPCADALVSASTRERLRVLVADCGAVALGSPEGVIGAAHVGWRGLLAGVVENTVEAMLSLGASAVCAGLGPCIHACCYAFSPRDLDAVARKYGDAVRAKSSSGEHALDLPAAVRAALDSAGVDLVLDVDACTGCDASFYSHRARSEEERQALYVWADRDP